MQYTTKNPPSASAEGTPVEIIEAVYRERRSRPVRKDAVAAAVGINGTAHVHTWQDPATDRRGRLVDPGSDPYAIPKSYRIPAPTPDGYRYAGKWIYRPETRTWIGKRYYPIIHAMARRWWSRHEGLGVDAGLEFSDLIAEGMAVVALACEEHDPDLSPIDPWIRQRVLGRYADLVKAALAQKRQVPGPEVRPEDAGWGDSDDTWSPDRSLTGMCLDEILATLDEEDRTIILMTAAGFADPEISERLGCNPKAAKKRRQRLQARMRAEFASEKGDFTLREKK